MSARSTSPDNAVGDEIAELLVGNDASQSSLAEATGVTQGYVSLVVSGKRQPSPEWLDLVVAALRVPQYRRQHIHRLAARAKGYKIDL